MTFLIECLCSATYRTVIMNYGTTLDDGVQCRLHHVGDFGLAVVELAGYWGGRGGGYFYNDFLCRALWGASQNVYSIFKSVLRFCSVIIAGHQVSRTEKCISSCRRPAIVESVEVLVTGKESNDTFMLHTYFSLPFP